MIDVGRHGLNCTTTLIQADSRKTKIASSWISREIFELDCEFLRACSNLNCRGRECRVVWILLFSLIFRGAKVTWKFGGPRISGEQKKKSKWHNAEDLGHAFRDTCAEFRRKHVENRTRNWRNMQLFRNLTNICKLIRAIILLISCERRRIVRCNHRQAERKANATTIAWENELTQYACTRTTVFLGSSWNR